MTDDAVLTEARNLLQRLRNHGSAADIASGKAFLELLRNRRAYAELSQLLETVSRLDPDDIRVRRLYAQYLIDTGTVTPALALLRSVSKRNRDAVEKAEIAGLLGRAYKQLFVDAVDKASPAARTALKLAIAAYREPYEQDPARTWQGVNLLALAVRAQRLGLRAGNDIDTLRLAHELTDTLNSIGASPAKADPWLHPSLAEAALGRGDWDAVERHVRAYVAVHSATAFQVAGTLRQFTEIWDLENADARGRDLVNILRARLAELPGGSFTFKTAELRRLQDRPTPSTTQLEAVLGTAGAQTYQWWQKGLESARSVAAIRQRLGDRVGTGFAVRAGDLGLTPAEEILVLTNYHVLNPDGVAPGLRPDVAEIVFEAADPTNRYRVEQVLWHSPPERHDACLVRTRPVPQGIAPLAIAPQLPLLDSTARVYVIGHAGGHDLAFSFQDNEVLDHEGPPVGQPAINGVCRIHYRTPTEGGSSGSPVLNHDGWEVVALHHKGGKLGMPRLNGKSGTYAANEGITMASIVAAISGR